MQTKLTTTQDECLEEMDTIQASARGTQKAIGYRCAHDASVAHDYEDALIQIGVSKY